MKSESAMKNAVSNAEILIETIIVVKKDSKTSKD